MGSNESGDCNDRKSAGRNVIECTQCVFIALEQREKGRVLNDSNAATETMYPSLLIVKRPRRGTTGSHEQGGDPREHLAYLLPHKLTPTATRKIDKDDSHLISTVLCIQPERNVWLANQLLQFKEFNFQ